MGKRLNLRPSLAGFLLAALAVLAVAPALGTPLPASGQASGAAVLTNDDIVKMVRAKLNDSVVVAKIKSSPCKFDTSTEALIKLNQVGVSDAVLAAMAEGPTAVPTPAKTASTPPPDPDDPLSPHPPGIYYFRQSPPERRMVLLEPAVSSGEKGGGFFKTAMTYGIAKSKFKLVVRGARAPLRVTEKHPTFYFYFDEKSNAFGSSTSLGASPSNPNDFVLARMETKKDERQLVVGQMNMFSTSSGMRSKDTLLLDIQKVGPGAYRVQPREDPEPGEYGFFYAGGAQMIGMTGGRVFDFGVNVAE